MVGAMLIETIERRRSPSASSRRYVCVARLSYEAPRLLSLQLRRRRGDVGSGPFRRGAPMIWLVLAVGIAVWVGYDLLQRKHAILRNFPVLGHFRFWLEAVGPELRQYIVTGNDEERPFSRDERRWVYASSKRENNYFGFGSDNDMESTPNYLIIKHSAFPLEMPHQGDAGFDSLYPIACGKVIGAARGRSRSFRPTSIVNVSGMSFGSLSGPAIEAINRGAAI